MREKEVEVVRKDIGPDANTVYVERKERTRSRFLLGLILGAAVIVGGAALYASQQGSYQSAGADVDRGLAVAENNTREAGRAVGDATEDAGDAIERETDKVEPQ